MSPAGTSSPTLIQDHKINTEMTIAMDPAALEEKKKVKEEEMHSEIESLKNKVGLLSPSEVVAKAALEQAKFDAIVEDPSKDDSNPKGGDKKDETSAIKEVVAKKPEGGDEHNKEAKDKPVFSIQTL